IAANRPIWRSATKTLSANSLRSIGAQRAKVKRGSATPEIFSHTVISDTIAVLAITSFFQTTEHWPATFKWETTRLWEASPPYINFAGSDDSPSPVVARKLSKTF